MTTKVSDVSRELRSLGASPEVIRLVQRDLNKKDAPVLDDATSKKLREICAEENRAVLVLMTNGHYKVFTVAGHEILRVGAKKHRPWEHSKKSRRGETKH